MMATLTTAAALPSSAERSVREVALRLGIPNVDHVVQQMRQEYVLTDWQLSALDSFQWKSLGAPIGLAVAVHQIIQQEQRQQQQQLFVFPSDTATRTTQESKILHDLDQHNNIMESAIFGIHNTSVMDEEEKDDNQVPVSSCTAVDAAVEETSIIINEESESNESESNEDENSRNSEVIVTEQLEADGALEEEDYLTELLADTTKTESSLLENDPDEVKDVVPEISEGIVSIEEAVSPDRSSPQEAEDENVDVNVTSIDINSSISSSIENDGDTNVNVLQESSEVPVDKKDEPTKPDSIFTSDTSDEDARPTLDKSPLRESSSWDATDEDVDTVPTTTTTSMSEESVEEGDNNNNSYYYNKLEVSPTLSAPLPHDECDDSFHVSQSKELLVRPSFDSEDIGKDPESFGGTPAIEQEESKGRDNNKDSLPMFFQKQNSQCLDSFADSGEEVDEDESLDPEDDIIISGQDLLVDLSGDPQAPLELPTTTGTDKKEAAATGGPLEFSFGQFRTPLVDPNSVTITAFRTGSENGHDDDDDDEHHHEGEGSTTEMSISEPYSMHKRAVSSLESLYYVDGDACTVVASNVSPERRNRPKRRRSLEDSTSHSIHTFSHVSSFDVEWDEFCLILGTVPSKTQRTILSQLLIMTNGRTKAARYKMAKQVSQMILKYAPRKEEDETQRKAQTAQLRSNLQLFAKLHREERKALGKKIFEQISKLYISGALDDDDKLAKETTAPSNDGAPPLEQAPPDHHPPEKEVLEQIL